MTDPRDFSCDDSRWLSYKMLWKYWQKV